MSHDILPKYQVHPHRETMRTGRFGDVESLRLDALIDDVLHPSVVSRATLLQ